MTSDLDIYRSANLLIKQRGDNAPAFAAMQTDKRAQASDMEGRAVWLRVIRAIRELFNRQPPADRQPLH